MGNALRSCLRGSEVHHDDPDSSVGKLLLSKAEQCRSPQPKMQQQQQQHQQQQQQHQPQQQQQPQSLLLPVEMKPSMEILPSSQEGVVRVKLIISTHQMANMINASCKKDDFLESLITSLLKEKGISMPEPAATKKITSCGGSWKPALESIPEVRAS